MEISMFNLKGILFDIDNTFTNTKSVVSDTLIKSVHELSKTKIKFGICTGRTYVMVKRYILPMFPQDSVHIFSGGGEIRNGKGEILWQRNINSKTMSQIIKLAETHKASYFYSDSNFVYGSKSILDEIKKIRWSIKTDASAKPIFATPLIFVTNTGPELSTALNKLKRINIISINKIPKESSYFDITGNQVTKLTGIKKWVEINKIPLNNIIGIGDSENDFDMIKNVGYGVAMGNAEDSIKAIAKLTIGHTDDDGLSSFIDESILSKWSGT